MEDHLLRLHLSQQRWSSPHTVVLSFSREATVHLPTPQISLIHPFQKNVCPEALTSQSNNSLPGLQAVLAWRTPQKTDEGESRVSHGKRSEKTRYTVPYIKNILLFVGGTSIYFWIREERREIFMGGHVKRPHE